MFKRKYEHFIILYNSYASYINVTCIQILQTRITCNLYPPTFLYVTCPDLALTAGQLNAGQLA